MQRAGKLGSTRWQLPAALAILLASLVAVISDAGIGERNAPESSRRPFDKIQAEELIVPPRTMVLRGPSPETERAAAVFASLGSFEVFVAPLGDSLARTAEKVELENDDSCRSAAQTLSVDSIKLECIRRAPPTPLPDCSLGIDLRGSSSSAVERAWIYAVLNNGEPCPFFDSLAPRSSDPFRGTPLRPWAGSRLFAQVASPTPRSILRALGIEPNSHGR
jgi:hypothetical protein